MPVNIVLSFLISHSCHSFQYFGQHIEILWKKVVFIFTFLVKIDTDTDPANLCRYHRIHNTAKQYIILSIFPGGPIAKAGAF
jgi:hypothetical protein